MKETMKEKKAFFKEPPIQIARKHQTVAYVWQRKATCRQT